MQLQSTTASYGQLMASKTVYPIDWPLPYTLQRAVPPDLHLHSAKFTLNLSQDLLQPVGREHATFGMPVQRTAYAATRGSLSSRIVEMF